MLLVALSFSVMSFRQTKNQNENLATKIETKTSTQLFVSKGSNQFITPVAVTVALAETSYAATVVATAAAYHWLFGDSESLAISNEYKGIMQEVDMRNLDGK